jgi:hypothetical protein
MSKEQTEQGPGQSKERRSSVRVRSMLPCAVQVIDAEQIPEMEARILDMAVVESDGALQDTVDWSERSEELPREVVFMLNEVRALRQQITEIQRQIERQGEGALKPHWITVNDRGFHVALADDDPVLTTGDFVEFKLRIPSIHNPDVLALGEVVRVDETPKERSAAVEFRAISDLHKKAILRYAMRRERQLARSKQAPVFRDDGSFNS